MVCIFYSYQFNIAVFSSIINLFAHIARHKSIIIPMDQQNRNACSFDRRYRTGFPQFKLAENQCSDHNKGVGNTWRKLNISANLKEGDKLYIAGHKEYVEQFLDYLEGQPDRKRRLVIIAGANRLSEIIASKLLEDGTEVRFVEDSHQLGEDLLNNMPDDVMIVHGDITDEEVLKEAGIAKCDTFIGIEEEDEKNILSCILAKRLGARKVVAVTHKPEYISILPAMDVIDCGFNTTLVSLNAIFRLIGESSVRIDSRLLAFQAFLKEFTIKPSSTLIGKTLRDFRNSTLPSSAVLAMIFRGNDVITPNGDTELKEGDVVAAIVTPASEEQIKPYFG